MSNPFKLRWLQGWCFQLVLMEGNVKIEAYGFGICLRTSLLPGEEPSSAADRLVLSENKRRKAIHKSWITNKSQSISYEMSENFIGKPSNNHQEHLARINPKEDANNVHLELPRVLLDKIKDLG